MTPSSTVHSKSIFPPIVAIGAAAGGVVALQKVFRRLPKGMPFAIVVLQDLTEGYSQRLAGLISSWTNLPVHEADTHLVPKIGEVYLPSPGRVLTIDARSLRASKIEGDRLVSASVNMIDRFLEGLAQHHGSRAVAVILSGKGMDGAAGALCIRNAGGIVIVQDPLTALHDSMPNAVIRRGLHDHILPPGAIGSQILACGSNSYSRPRNAEGTEQMDNRVLARILLLVRVHSGIDFTGYKTAPLLWRVKQRMDRRHVREIADYASLISEDPVELESLIRDIPLHVTEFFRDPGAWAALKEEVLLPLMRTADAHNPVRTWTAGCASGEEAYSLAMTLEDIKQEIDSSACYQSFVTDASPEIVHRARCGVFAPSDMATVSQRQRTEYFFSADKMFTVRGFLREQMVFSSQNLISDPPFANMDLVTCRNLLIYLEPSTARQIIYILHSALREGGYLFLGGSESYDLEQSGFSKVSGRFNIFRKTGIVLARANAEHAASQQRRNISTLNAGLLRQANEDFVFPSVLVDDHGRLLRVYGAAGDILRIPAGEPTNTLLSLLPWQWVDPLRRAMCEALAQDQQRIVRDLYDRVDLRIRVIPIRVSAENPPSRMLLSFMSEESGQFTLVPSVPLSESVDQHRSGVRRCAGPPEKIQSSSHQEYDALRERLLAVNEELLASNILLNTSNDNLHGANAELHEKIAQLEIRAEVLSSGEVMTIFLDKDRRVRWFTPATTRLFPLKPEDVGRDIHDLVPRFRDPSFLSDIQEVLRSSEIKDAIVHGDDDRWYRRRLVPHEAAIGTIDGVAVTFEDFTTRRHVENALWASEDMHRHSQMCLSSQKAALQLAMNGAPLTESLEILRHTMTGESGDRRSAAFYVMRESRLHHLKGMPDAYARYLNGADETLESASCKFALATNQTVTTCDILRDERWKPWALVSSSFGYRGCWSFPIRTGSSQLVGALVVYFGVAQTPEPVDLQLAAAMIHTAAIIISRKVGVDVFVANGSHV
ncbi:PAS domain-containing protein (plasmid) [Cupriavidus pauculus]|uniref:PAS domain-containing protein n=1 Tax=Cupriavidus pauculus TaxID=82633 RepID=A0A5P2H8U7_9BURK|nr:CheR family methyltransferase [Cupriavidus pauculus]QET03933.1 PAS domain-containing protein [Cupriavidus pauculus]